MTTRRVAKIARAVSLREQETKRTVITADGVFGNLTGGVGLFTWREYCNAFSGLGPGSGFNQIEGNEFVNPLVKLNAELLVDWGQVAAATGGVAAPVRYVVTLLAVGEEATNSPSFIVMPTSVQNNWMQEQEIVRMAWEGQSVTVIKQWTYQFHPPDIPTGGATGTGFAFRYSNKKIECTKRLRGKKEFEISQGSTQLTFLKGYNYYWVMSAGYMTGSAVSASLQNGLGAIVDHYTYFKDP